MRLHALSLTAFGPFPGTVTVDLDDVARDGLFLLWGPTGAGKTTLLDAVTFALYGSVPGVRGHEKRLRSDHADAGTRTEVTCELSLAGERLRVVRRPEQSRPKKRGAGVTTEPARMLVSRWAEGTWEPVSARIDEGSEFLASRLGLSAEQFCQVVLLPQGEFARFLRAEPEDRAKLLGTLFDVGRFADVEEWLTTQRRTAEEALRHEQLRMSTLVARVAQAADADVPEELAPELVGVASGSRVDAWVRTMRAQVSAALEAAGSAAEQAREAAGRLDAALVAARSLADRHARRDRAVAELDRLTAAEEGLAALRARRDAGRGAEVLRDVLRQVDDATAAAAAAGAALAGAREAWTAVGGGRDATAEDARSLRDAAAEVRRLLPDAEQAVALRLRGAELDRQAAALLASSAAAEEDLGFFPTRIDARRAAVDRAQAAGAALPGLRAAADAAGAAEAAAGEAEAAAGAAGRARAAVQVAHEAWVAAREQLVEVRSRRLDGMAAELAAGLSAGDACPVCGAREHPAPARPAGPVVSADDEDRARAAVDAAESRLATLRQAAERGERELAVLRERAGDGAPAELAVRAATARAERDEAAGLAGSLPAERAALVALTAARDAAAAQAADDRTQAMRLQAERDALAERCAELDDRLDRARAGDPDLPTRLRRLVREAERCEAVVTAVAEDERARAARDLARSAAARRVTQQGFADLAAAAAALLEPGELARADARIRQHEHARAAQESALADPELTGLDALPDLDALGRACASATGRREDAVAAAARLLRSARALDELAGDVVASGITLDERRTEAARVSGLAELVTGRGANTLRMRLQSFVLAARLEQVAAVASRRLQDMCGGRYTFLHSDAQGRHGARGGLGLDVLDEHTGARRPTKTLSGGESFMASLALALALADVVTAETGGVTIDTLFVDEGFGTLDAGALDAVMGVLDELRRGGRVVGVVSHVEELRQRIPARLEVVASRRGSRLAG